jgi:hypothetical protein
MSRRETSRQALQVQLGGSKLMPMDAVVFEAGRLWHLRTWLLRK